MTPRGIFHKNIGLPAYPLFRHTCYCKETRCLYPPPHFLALMSLQSVVVKAEEVSGSRMCSGCHRDGEITHGHTTLANNFYCKFCHVVWLTKEGKLDAIGRGVKVPTAAACCDCKRVKSLWASKVGETADGGVVKNKVNGDRCRRCWYQRLSETGKKVEAVPPPLSQERSMVRARSMSPPLPGNLQELKRARVSVPAECADFCDQVVKSVSSLARDVRGQGAVLGGVTELTSGITRATVQDVVCQTLDACGNLLDQRKFDCLKKINIICQHDDPLMVATYGTRLQDSIVLLGGDTPALDRVQSKLSFRCKSNSSIKKDFMNSMKDKVVCPRHIVGRVCNGLCGFKYHFASPDRLTSGEYNYLVGK